MEGQGAIHRLRRIQRGPVHGVHTGPEVIGLEVMLNRRFAWSSAPFSCLSRTCSGAGDFDNAEGPDRSGNVTF
jgi:hypothetical protein